MSTEIVTVDMTVDDARRLTQRIRLTAQNFIETKSKLISLVEQAKAGNAHLALGYASWTAYLSDVLGDEPLRLARDDRQEMVAILSAEGMSTRAIAPIVGVHHATVAEDIRESTVGFPTVDRPTTVTSLDGRERPATRPTPVLVDRETGEVNRRLVLEELFPARRRKRTPAQWIAHYVTWVGAGSHGPEPSWTSDDVATLSDEARTELDHMLTESIEEMVRRARHLRALQRTLREAP